MGIPITTIEKNSYIRVIAITAVVLGGFITIFSFFGAINDYLYEKIFIAKNISNKIERLSAGQSINYFKQELWSEQLQRAVSSKYTEYVFEYKKFFIQTLVENQTNTVVYWAITYCGSNPVVMKRKVFSSAGRYSGKKDIFGNRVTVPSFGNVLFLNKSTFTDIYKDVEGWFEYNISEATANSFAYEYVSLWNPSFYQMIIVGINDVCPGSFSTIFTKKLYYSWDAAIDVFRENSVVNTYWEIAPFYDTDIIDILKNNPSDEEHLTFGVDRVNVRYFNQ